MEGLLKNSDLNKIDTQLKKTKAAKRIGLMTHIVVGYPNLTESRKIVDLMIKKGVDFIELQIPFSDPMADGPTIMQANKVALDEKTSVTDALKLMTELTKAYPKFPFLFMTYFNIVHKYGVEKFCKAAALAGCSGLIVPDIPLEEEVNEHYMQFCNESNLYGIRLLAPASTDQRIKLNADVAQGFMYLSARQGTTGSQSELEPKLIENIQKIKKISDIAVAVGFGISQNKHIQALKNHAEIAVVGSALLEVYNKDGLIGLASKLDELVGSESSK